MIDTRDSISQVREGIIKDAYMFKESGSLAGWIGSLITPKDKVLIFSVTEDKAQEVVRRVVRIGYKCLGYNKFTLQ